MDYTFELTKYLKDEDIPIPNDTNGASYVYLGETYTGLKELVGGFFTSLFINITGEEKNKILKYIEEKNDKMKNSENTKKITITIGNDEYELFLSNYGSTGLLGRLKAMYEDFSKEVKLQPISSNIIFKNLPDKNGKNDKIKAYLMNKGNQKGIVKKKISEAIKNNKKQIVLTGAPGTGKTYSVKDYVDNYKGNYKGVFSQFVQFHPSYDYSDFVEGLRPIQKDGQMVFERIDGCFKEFCRKVVVYNNFHNKSYLNQKDTNLNLDGEDKDPLFFFIIDEINRADLSNVFGELMYCLEDSYRGKENQIPTQYSRLLTYDSDKNMYLDGTEKDENGIVINEDVFKDGFYIPQNVIIIGTMNDIDKSVDAFDFALRRRFEWIDIKANAVMKNVLDTMYKNNSNIQQIVPRIIGMNELISGEEGKKFRLSEAYHIGPAYFKGIDITDENTVKESLQRVFNYNIVSILKEYTRGKDEKLVNRFIHKCAEKLGVEYAE